MKPEAMRGLILVIAAALVGALVLAVGFDDTAQVSAGTTSPEPTATPAPVLPTPEPTVAPADDPATIDVLVANGTGTTGLAGSVSTQLNQNFGYRTAEPTNAEPAPADGRSIVYYTAGSESAAVGVAQRLGVESLQVQPLPATPPVSVDLAGVEVLVILADDLLPAGG